MNSDYILGVDTSHSRGQLCLLENQKVIENIFWEKSGSHSENINLRFEELLQNHGLNVSSITKIYCSIGPGSFTGLRVGVNFCKTLSYANNCELFPVNTLQGLSYLCTDNEKPILSVIDAQKNALFISLFNKDRIIQKENLIVGFNDLSQYIKTDTNVTGSGFDRYSKFIDQKLLDKLTLKYEWKFPDITAFMKSNEELHFLKCCKWEELQPLYLKLSSAEEKRNAN